jgi:hypothetical protein
MLVPALLAASIALAPHTIALADGAHRVVVYDDAAHTARVVDDTEPLGAGRALTVPTGCAPQAAATGRLVYACVDPARANGFAMRPLIEDLATGEQSVPAGAQAIFDAQVAAESSDNGPFTFSGLGTQMLAVTYRGSHGDAVFLHDLQTGVKRLRDLDPGPMNAPSLDTATGSAPLCAPVRRRVRQAEFDYVGLAAQWQEAAVAGPRVLRWWPAPDSQFTPSAALTLQRCGSPTTWTLARRGFSSPILTARYAAWIQGRTVHVATFATHRRLTMRLPKVKDAYAASWSLAGTDRRIIATPRSTAIRGRVFTLPAR